MSSRPYCATTADVGDGFTFRVVRRWAGKEPMTRIAQWCERMARRCLRAVCVFIMTGPAFAAEVSTFAIGRSSQPDLYYAPAFLHGAYAFEYIRITFNADVLVDFYDLQLQAVGVESNVIAATGFSYDPATRAAIWTVAGQATLQNARYLATLTGVHDAAGGLLPGGIYTNSFSILTGDVTGDDQVSALDPLILINHINGGLPYQPALDVNWDGVISPVDVLIVIDFLNQYGDTNLAAPGAYRTVPMDPFAKPVIKAIHKVQDNIVVAFSGVPSGRQASITGKALLSDVEWYAVVDFEVTNGLRAVSFPWLPHLSSEFYKMSVR